MKKKLFHLLLIILLTLPMMLYAHSGGTDSSGGHYDHSTGEYHYHHGERAHQHYNGVCEIEMERMEKQRKADALAKAFGIALVVVLVSSSVLLLIWIKKEGDV